MKSSLLHGFSEIKLQSAEIGFQKMQRVFVNIVSFEDKELILSDEKNSYCLTCENN